VYLSFNVPQFSGLIRNLVWTGADIRFWQTLMVITGVITNTLIKMLAKKKVVGGSVPLTSSPPNYAPASIHGK